LHHLFHGGIKIPPVQVKQVDVISLEVFERIPNGMLERFVAISGKENFVFLVARKGVVRILLVVTLDYQALSENLCSYLCS